MTLSVGLVLYRLGPAGPEVLIGHMGGPFFAHRHEGGWTFPTGLSAKSIWLAYYVILSRPTALANLLSFGCPKREIIEGGPPDGFVGSFDRLFGSKIQSTRQAAREARRHLGWN